MTVDEIKRKLDALGVGYPPDARKTELEQLLAEAAEDAATAPETPASDPEPDPAEPGPEIGPRPRTVATDAGALNIRREPGGAVSRAWCPTAPSSRQSAIRRTAGSAWLSRRGPRPSSSRGSAKPRFGIPLCIPTPEN